MDMVRLNRKLRMMTVYYPLMIALCIVLALGAMLLITKAQE